MSLVSLERWFNQPGGDFQLPAQKQKVSVVWGHWWGPEAPMLKVRQGCSEGSLLQGPEPFLAPLPTSSSATAGASVSGSMENYRVSQVFLPQTESLEQSSQTPPTHSPHVPCHFLFHMFSSVRPGGAPLQLGCWLLVRDNRKDGSYFILISKQLYF